MAAPRPERRLAAVLVADVAGYSRLMGRDEVGTLARLAGCRRELLEPLLAEHRGRIVNFPGDNVLCEFASVVDAVECAVAIQRGVAERERDVPEPERLRFRIGINAADVVSRDGDLYGDGVNIAARLERLAEPGGVCVSGGVREEVRGQLPLAFEDLGERRLRNIARPVRAYRLARGRGAARAADLLPPERPSIAVLPFADPGGDPAQAYFGDGITEDIVTELSRFRDLLVIARHSSFAFRGAPVDPAEIGRRLGVRFLLEGSVRKAGGRVRITAQLIDAATGARPWAARYDRTLEDVFAVQEEVAAVIAATLAGRIEAVGAERARREPTSDLAAYDCVLRGMDHLAGHGDDANARARAMFERAVEIDPAYALARAYLALAIYVQEVLPRATAETALGRALGLAREAAALDAGDSRCQRILGQLELSAGEFERADFHSERATTLNPNDAHAAAFRANALSYLGRHEEALACMRTAMRLNPVHPGWYWHMLARALHCAGRHGDAVAAYERIEVRRFFELAYLAACHARLRRGAQARRLAERTLAAEPGFSSGAWVLGLPFRHEEDRRRLLEELLAAGLPP